MADRTGRAVPSGRLARLARFGSLATGVAANVVRQGAGQLVRGERPELGELLLTPANVRRFTEQLARLRGAAMKLGQLVSMDGGDLLEPELAEIMARLRADAEPMPDAQLGQVLAAEWGTDWKAKLSAFDAKPIAAASIGQVHRGRDKTGRNLAVKIQYPGVAQSIDSDVDNVATLLRMSGLVPKGLDIVPLLAEAKQQLRQEADYRREGACLARFGVLLAGDDRFHVPGFLPELSTERILAMTFAAGRPLEQLSLRPQEERDRVAGQLLELVLRELFEFGLMQTDPNLANYRYNVDGGQVVLLDFGATRELAPDTVALYRDALRAALAADRDAASDVLTRFGIFDDAMSRTYRDRVLDLFDFAVAELFGVPSFDFGESRLIAVGRDNILPLLKERTSFRAPPVDALFVNRKLAGTFLLARRLRARVPLRTLVERFVR